MKSSIKLLFVGFFGIFLVMGAGCISKKPQGLIPDDFGNNTTTSSITKKYVAKGKEQCDALRFQCEVGKKPFFDEVGCGCEDDITSAEFCTEEYKPVCGELEVQCIRAPCPPIRQTYGNRCLAEKENAKNIIEGECAKTTGNDFLEVSDPQDNAVLKSPAAIKGRVLAPWLSEGVAPIQITDTAGKVLGSGQIKGPADWMTRSGWMDFSSSIEFKKGSAAKGFVVFKKDNPSGRPENDMSIKLAVSFEDVTSTPQICTTQYDPVCGEITSTGTPKKQTYSNRCMAEKAGAKNIVAGECKLNSADYIKIQSLKAGDVINTPLTVTGEAKGPWLWEGTFPVDVVDKTGMILGKGVAEAQSDWMTENFVKFIAKVEFKNNNASEGYLLFRNENPSGNANLAMELKLPVKFKTATSTATLTCKPTGCSKELCSDKEMTSICIYKPEFDCYRQATCGAQANGQCGWTETPALKACLEKARKEKGMIQ